MSFTLNNLGYVVGGFDGTSYYNDVWQFDPILNNWTQLDTFLGAKRALGVAFATSNYGYAGNGWNGSGANGNPVYFLNDFFKYDPVANIWSAIPSLPTPNGLGRKFAVAFGIGAPYNIGGVLGGTDQQFVYKDFYVWNEANNTWTTEPYPGPKRSGSVAWVYQNRAYVVTGVGDNSLNLSDFSMYDPSRPIGYRWTDSLKRIFGVTDQSYDAGYRVQRTNAVAFTGLDNGVPKGFVALGSNGSSLADCWEYDYAMDLWTEKSNFPGVARVGAIAMTLNTPNPVTKVLEPHGYVGLGGQSLSVGPGGTVFSDFTEFFPDLPFNSDDYFQQ
jgi:N-acetylneuraminic acid mutarotase